MAPLPGDFFRVRRVDGEGEAQGDVRDPEIAQAVKDGGLRVAGHPGLDPVSLAVEIVFPIQPKDRRNPLDIVPATVLAPLDIIPDQGRFPVEGLFPGPGPAASGEFVFAGKAVPQFGVQMRRVSPHVSVEEGIRPFQQTVGSPGRDPFGVVDEGQKVVDAVAQAGEGPFGGRDPGILEFGFAVRGDQGRIGGAEPGRTFLALGRRRKKKREEDPRGQDRGR